jgi:NAD+ synthase (glutamine-hydrolysing)
MVVDIHLASASKAIDAIELGAMPSRPKKAISKNKPVRAQAIPSAYGALVYGLREYMSKNGFRKAVLGMSGGIDSSLTAAIAVDAIGRENVTGVYMPTRYSSAESEADAAAVAKNLGIKLLSIPVDPIFKIYLMSLEPKFAGRGRDIAEENLQARIRGNILMALSNKFGWLVLSTGNKSEIATGYGTLYGDMAGGFAVIKDALKTLVYKLAHYRNSIKKVIPAAIFEKDPTAELKFGQKDQDTLPPYKTLDAILKAYIEEEKTSDEIVKMGHGKNTVSKVISMVTRSEYKRRQAPPGTKITAKSFASKDRRMPITNRYEG